MRTLFLAAALIVASSAVSAQTSPCDSAATFVQGRALPPINDPGWGAWAVLSRCSTTGAHAMASALATSVITTELDTARVGQLFWFFDGYRNGELFSAYQNGATNAAATEYFRLSSVRALSGLVLPELDVAPPTTAGSQTCGTKPRRSAASGDSLSLPGNAYDAALQTSRSVASGGGSAGFLVLAGCWKRLLERNAPVATGKILLTYMCGNRFRVRNSNPAAVKVRFDVYKTGESGENIVHGGEDWFFDTLNKGTVRLFYGSQLIQTKANGGTVCR